MEWNLEVGKAAVERMKVRASCRVFTDDPIPDEVLRDILECGVRAASGGNLQPYSIIVVKDEAKRKQLADLNGGQQFMASAPVNLIFVLDWYKISRIARLQKAPFTAPQSYMHYLIGLEDLMCAAQAIETAAWQLGVGSVYIGTVNNSGREIAEIYNLPKHTYPVVILTMGYPKNELALRDRLPYEMTVFDERYPDFTDEAILQGFAAKYGEKGRALPTAQSVQEEWLARFREGLSMNFSPAEIEEIVAEVKSSGVMKHFQYVFGMHYHAKFMQQLGHDIMQMMQENELEPFYMLTKEENEA